MDYSTEVTNNNTENNNTYGVTSELTSSLQTKHSYEDIYSILYGGSPYNEEYNEDNKENSIDHKIQIREQIQNKLNMLRHQKQNKKRGIWNEPTLFNKYSVSDSLINLLIPCYHQGVYNLMYANNCLNRENISYFRKTINTNTPRFKKYERGNFVFE